MRKFPAVHDAPGCARKAGANTIRSLIKYARGKTEIERILTKAEEPEVANKAEGPEVVAA
jgi:hypothetical protein